MAACGADLAPKPAGAAAADAARDDLQTANLQRAPRRARKPLRVFIAAAACVALLTTGVAAAWSQIETAVVKDGFVVSQTGAARSGSITPIDFDALPEGSTAVEKTTAEGEIYTYTLNVDGVEFLLSKMAPGAKSVTFVADDVSEAERQELLNGLESYIKVYDSVYDIPADALNGWVTWSGSDCRYELAAKDSSAVTDNVAEKLLEVLKSMR